MGSSSPEKPQPADARRGSSTPLIRLAVVLVAAAVFLILFKPATAVDGKLQAVLDDRARAMRAGDRDAFQALHDPDAIAASTGWWEYEANLFNSYQDAREQEGAVDRQAEYPAFEVIETGRQMDTAWARVVVAGDVDAPPRVEFFRRVAGRWLLAAPDPAYWGEPAVHQALYFVWRYRAADDGRVKRLAPTADAAWGRMAADFDVRLPTALLPIEICYSFECGTGSNRDRDARYIMAPPLVGSSEADMEDVLVSLLMGDLSSLVIGPGGQDRAVGSPVLLAGIYTWEREQVTGRAPGWVAPLLAEAVASGALLSLDQISLSPDRGTYTLAHAQAYALVDYFVTHYNPRILPALLRAAGARSSITVTVQDVLPEGANVPAFEEQWRDYLRTTYGP
ncbi:MAG TPA: hypothetical protein VLC95_10105 [Anaerolineae bacterium]|nr:hypothetical protein [Anaerolineae bacterium]